MIIEKTFQGAYKISDFAKDGYLFTMQYFDYSLRDAKKLFRRDLKNYNNNKCFVNEKRLAK